MLGPSFLLVHLQLASHLQLSWEHVPSPALHSLLHFPSAAPLCWSHFFSGEAGGDTAVGEAAAGATVGGVPATVGGGASTVGAGAAIVGGVAPTGGGVAAGAAVGKGVTGASVAPDMLFCYVATPLPLYFLRIKGLFLLFQPHMSHISK